MKRNIIESINFAGSVVTGIIIQCPEVSEKLRYYLEYRTTEEKVVKSLLWGDRKKKVGKTYHGVVVKDLSSGYSEDKLFKSGMIIKDFDYSLEEELISIDCTTYTIAGPIVSYADSFIVKDTVIRDDTGIYKELISTYKVTITRKVVCNNTPTEISSQYRFKEKEDLEKFLEYAKEYMEPESLILDKVTGKVIEDRRKKDEEL